MPSSKPDIRPEGDDLEWLAFQYISGELSLEECHDFEMLLAEDQAARDSVVRAVRLTQATTLVFNASPGAEIRPARQPAAGRPRKSIYRLIAIAAAACLALALVFVPEWSFVRHDLPENGQASSHSEMHDLALAWASAREEIPAESRRISDESNVAAASVMATELMDVNEDIETPSWMLIAVEGSLQSSQTSDTIVD